LTGLLATCPGVDAVVPAGAALPDCDLRVPLVSVPGVLGITVDTIPQTVPYLFPDAALVERWRRELGGDEGLKVGIAWQGNTGFKSDRYRSIPLSHFLPLAELPQVRLYSLQFGEGREQLAASPRANVVDLSDRLGDFHNTAAIIRNLDLVITSDSAPAHLAGAIGMPVWVALACVPDWRWMLNRADSPWYPTMRLYRQKRPGDWAGVFQQIATDLAALAAARRG
jgi:ADP-heptose:LPS heptosyltransferase